MNGKKEEIRRRSTSKKREAHETIIPKNTGEIQSNPYNKKIWKVHYEQKSLKKYNMSLSCKGNRWYGGILSEIHKKSRKGNTFSCYIVI